MNERTCMRMSRDIHANEHVDNANENAHAKLYRLKYDNSIFNKYMYYMPIQ